MSFLVVALLSALWLAFFVPSLLEARRTSSPYTSATNFQASLRRLAAVPARRPATASRRRRSARAATAARRRDLLAALSAAVVAGGLLAVEFGGWAVWAPAPPLIALGGYTVMLRREVLRRSAQRRQDTSVAPGMGAAREARSAAAQHAADPVVEFTSDGLAIVPSVGRRSGVDPPERMAG